MVKKIEGMLIAKDKKLGVVVSRFNEIITNKLLEGALDCWRRHGGSEDDVTVVYVPGAFEIPQVAQKLVQSGKVDAVVCLGAVIRGATPHFEYVAAESAKGIAQVAIQTTEVPLTFGVLTCDTIEQAVERAGSKAGNKGWDATLSAIEMLGVYSKL